MEIREGLILANKLMLEEIPEVEKKTASGIILPNQVKRTETRKGKILLLGSAVAESIKVETGMTVLYPRMSITKFAIEEGDKEKEVGLLKDSDVLFAYWDESPLK